MLVELDSRSASYGTTVEVHDIIISSTRYIVD